jgi:beta-glucosidase-like glycosyl hydrolase
MRGIWNRSDVVVGTDCGAISNMINANHYAKDGVDAAAKALNGGADMELGDTYFSPLSSGGSNSLGQAIKQGLTTAARVEVSVRRLLVHRFRLGQFDPLENQPYTTIGAVRALLPAAVFSNKK